MEKIAGRLIGCLCVLSTLSACFLSGGASKAKEADLSENIPKQKEITETIIPEENPDVVELLKEEVRFTMHWEEDCSDTTLQISQEDAERLLKIAEAEAGDQEIDGMLKVMQVVMNRVQSPEYPDTIEEVITQPHQFQTVENETYYTAVPSVKAHLALAELEKNLNPDTSIIAFEMITNSKSLERYFVYAYTFGGHDFYVKR